MNLNLPLHLSRAHVLEQLERLAKVYKRPEQAPADPVAFADTYVEVCGDLTNAQFTGAVDAYLKTAARWFARPGELYTLGKVIARGPGASGLKAEYEAWERNAYQDPVTGRWTPCPVCGATMAWTVVRISASGEEIDRLMVLHNAAVHWKAAIGFSMRAAPGTGGGKWEHVVKDQRPKTVTPAPVQTAAPPAPAAPSDEQLERSAIQGEA